MPGTRGTLIRLAMIIALVLAILGGTSSSPSAAEKSPISPEVADEMHRLENGETLTVIVGLKKQATLPRPSSQEADPGTRDRRQREVVEHLKSGLETSRREVQPLLSKHQARGRLKEVVPLWISNSLAVTATPSVVRDLAANPEVAAITQNETIPAPVAPASTVLPAPEANLGAIHAPALWDLGFTGQGVVVANMDTGVDASHPDLSARWRGGKNSWFDPNGEHPDTPTDVDGHGTWTMGVMVGGGAGGTSVGVAPGATWISAKIFDDRGFATTVGIHRSFQWLLDPDGNPATADAPDVVNNSWALANPGCDLEFQPDLQALAAAGILPVFAAGNYGPNPETSPSPANYPEALSIGATDNADAVSNFSSRGPSSCGEAQGTPRTFPEIVAPGVDVKTTDLFGGYAAATGTSLAAPHAAGVLALLLDADPGLTTAQQREALTTTAADLGPAGPDNDSGHGRVDALAAYNYANSNFGHPAQPQATVLTLSSTSRTLTFGGSTNLLGTLSAGGTSLTGKPVVVEQRPAGSSATPFSEVAGGTLTTGPDGGYTLPGLRPDLNTEYRVRFPGDVNFEQSVSSSVTVSIRVRVSAHVSKATLRQGRSLTIYGNVAPLHSDSVRLTIRRGSVVVATRYAPLSGSGYRLNYEPPRVGDYFVRAEYATHGDHLGNASPWKGFRVIR